MVDSEKTFKEFGYLVSSLSPHSHKKIVASCDDCGQVRYLPKYAYRKICSKCSVKSCYVTPESRKKRAISVSGAKNHFFGKKHSKETKRKIADSLSKLPRKLNTGDAAKNKVIGRYLRSAKSRGLEFNLSRNEVEKLFFSDCHYCGSSPSNKAKHGKNNGDFIYNGIDRKDNDIGYISANCVPCCSTCNLAKRDTGLAEFGEWIKKVFRKLVDDDFTK